MANIESVKLPNGSEYNIKDAISGYALQSEMSVTDGTGSDADKTTIQLKSGTSATVLKTHQSISGKADKVTGGTNGNLASLDGNGNLTDAGVALNISTPSNGQLMKYNGTSGKWENADAPASAPMPNLLINGWFTVNQRGATSGTFTSPNTYFVDRWKSHPTAASNGTWSLDANGLLLDATNSTINIQQFYENTLPSGKTYTISVLLSDGTIYSGTKENMQASDFLFINESNIQVIFNLLRVAIIIPQSYSITVRAIKLELGSQSTLALDTAPDYTTELLKCQRYYYRLTGLANASYFGPAIVAQEHYCNVDLKLPTAMRTTPTISYSGSIYAYISNVQINFSNINCIYRIADYLTLTLYTTSSMTMGYAGIAALGNGSYIELDAEL